MPKIYWFSIKVFTILVNFQVLGQELKLIGSSDLGILPKDAQKICEKIGGELAILTEDNRKFFTDRLFEHCSTNSDFCPKMCVWDPDSEVNKTEIPDSEKKAKVMMTQRVYPGDTLHLKLEMKKNTMEIFQISDSLLEDLQVVSNIPKIQNITFQLGVYNKYSNQLEKSNVNNGITVERGSVKKFIDHVENNVITHPAIQLKKVINGTMELELEFTKNQMVRIHSPDLSENQTLEYQIEKLDGRMYFKKFYDDMKILDAYFTRGNCSKSSFYHFPGNETGGFVNCHWTRPTTPIPVYSCRKASFVACSNVPLPSTTTPNPTTLKLQKKTKKNNKNDTADSEVFDETEEPKSTAENYFHAEFLDEHIMFFVTLSGLSVALLVGSIVLQEMKMWQNRKLKIVKKKNK